ncbi:MAG: flavodoxin domain-containing protein [Candidatus Melainabacteria bacterium]
MSHGPHDRHSVKDFFEEFYPVIFFGSCFLLMVSLPLVFSGFLSLNALGIAVAFALAALLTFFAPGFLWILLIAIVVTIWCFYPEHTYNRAGGFLTALLLLMTVAGPIFLWGRKVKKELDATPVGQKIAAVDAASSPEPAAAAADAGAELVPDEKPLKPVAFDKDIAASGVTIIFGTESGNAEGLAEVAANKLKGDGLAVQILDAKVVDHRHLPAFANLLILTSTWGDGDPPSNAIDLVAGIKSTAMVSMKGSQFSVLSLGDTSYPQFCQCGKEFDQYLEKFGAKRAFNRVDCDLDYDAPFQGWLDGVHKALKGNLASVAPYTPPVIGSAGEATLQAAPAT